MTALEKEIRARLTALAEPGYRDFSCKLAPGLTRERVLGVRLPALRQLVRALARREDVGDFLSALPHAFFDEDNLHALILSEQRDYDRLLPELERFLPHVDNWATCDMLRPAAFRRERERLLGDIRRWLDDPAPFTVRFALEMLMVHFLDDGFCPEALDWAAALRSEEYYVNMMIAWHFATALAKRYEATLPYLEQGRLGNWTHNKTIQKARESLRVPPERKAYLQTLRK